MSKGDSDVKHIARVLVGAVAIAILVGVVYVLRESDFLYRALGNALLVFVVLAVCYLAGMIVGDFLPWLFKPATYSKCAPRRRRS